MTAEEKVIEILSALPEGGSARPADLVDAIPYGEFWKTMDGLRHRGLVDRTLPSYDKPWSQFRIGGES